MLWIFDIIKEHGPNIGKPYTDSFGDGLFEVRAKGKEGIGWSLFCYASKDSIVILHSFVKKTQKSGRVRVRWKRPAGLPYPICLPQSVLRTFPAPRRA